MDTNMAPVDSPSHPIGLTLAASQPSLSHQHGHRFLAAQTPRIHVGLNTNMGQGYKHRPQPQQDYGPRHGPWQPGLAWPQVAVHATQIGVTPAAAQPSETIVAPGGP